MNRCLAYASLGGAAALVMSLPEAHAETTPSTDERGRRFTVEERPFVRDLVPNLLLHGGAPFDQSLKSTGVTQYRCRLGGLGSLLFPEQKWISLALAPFTTVYEFQNGRTHLYGVNVDTHYAPSRLGLFMRNVNSTTGGPVEMEWGFRSGYRTGLFSAYEEGIFSERKKFPYVKLSQDGVTKINWRDLVAGLITDSPTTQFELKADVVRNIRSAPNADLALDLLMKETSVTSWADAAKEQRMALAKAMEYFRPDALQSSRVADLLDMKLLKTLRSQLAPTLHATWETSLYMAFIAGVFDTVAFAERPEKSVTAQILDLVGQDLQGVRPATPSEREARLIKEEQIAHHVWEGYTAPFVAFFSFMAAEVLFELVNRLGLNKVLEHRVQYEVGPTSIVNRLRSFLHPDYLQTLLMMIPLAFYSQWLTNAFRSMFPEFSREILSLGGLIPFSMGAMAAHGFLLGLGVVYGWRGVRGVLEIARTHSAAMQMVPDTYVSLATWFVYQSIRHQVMTT